MLIETAIAIVERILTTAIKSACIDHVRFNDLYNKKFLFIISEPKINICVILGPETIKLSSVKVDDCDTQEYDLCVSCSTYVLLKLASDKPLVSDDKFTVEGSNELSILFREYIKAIKIDTDLFSAEVFGHGPAYFIKNTGSFASNWIGRSVDNLLYSASQSMQHEHNLTPSKESLAKFYTDIDTFSQDVDRLCANFLQSDFLDKEKNA